MVGVFIKTSIKGLIWYDPRSLDLSASAPTTWDALQTAITTNKSKAAAPWCLGVESGAASGWPGTDWIEDFVLRQAGPDVYNQWWQGKIKWSDPAIKTAFQSFGQIVASSYGGATAVNATNFANAGDPLFKTPPGCLFLHQASFITGLGAFPKTATRDRLQLLPLPRHQHPVHGRRRGRRRPVRHVPQHAGGGLAHGVPRDRSGPGHLGQDRRRDLGQQERHRLSGRHQQALGATLLANAKIFVFDASDLMPTAMNNEFWADIVKYVQHPDQLDAHPGRPRQDAGRRLRASSPPPPPPARAATAGRPPGSLVSRGSRHGSTPGHGDHRRASAFRQSSSGTSG